MDQVYLDGQFIAASAARISPMDRGFLFGDGIYEVIPSHQGQLIGFVPHIARMLRGLTELEIAHPWTISQWRSLVEKLLALNGNGDLAVYLQVSRGVAQQRSHAFPIGITPTVFAFTFAIAPETVADKTTVKAITVTSATDLRWRRCHLKSTALLGNVLHHQQGVNNGDQETLLFNQHDELTEASSANVFVVKQQRIATPPLDQQILPGITRALLLQILRQHSHWTVEERVISKAEVLAADEIWLTSSSKELVPVIAIDKQPVGDGVAGDVWLEAQRLFSRHKYHNCSA